MVEIALCLAIIGFALVAIIGVLPLGLSVQKENRQQTIINLDAAFLMDVLRNGAQGQNDLPNYFTNITITNTLYDSLGHLVPGSMVSSTYSGNQLSSGSNIVGLLSTPKYVATNGDRTLGWGYFSNTVTAAMRAINSPAVDQGPNGTNFAFYYQVQVEVIPSAQYAYAWGSPFNFKRNVTAPGYVTALPPPTNDVPTALALQNNLNEIRLSYRWPILPGAAPGGVIKFGTGRQVFRTSAAGVMWTNTAVTPNLYFIKPLSYQAP